MRLKRVHIRDYRSVNDSGEFDVEPGKTILVGVNEAGKTCLLTAIEQINPPPSRPQFKALTDYPRARYTEVQRNARPLSDVEIVAAIFDLSEADQVAITNVAPSMKDVKQYKVIRRLDNTSVCTLPDAPAEVLFGDIVDDLRRTCKALETASSATLLLSRITEAMAAFALTDPLTGTRASVLEAHLNDAVVEIDEDNKRELNRLRKLRNELSLSKQKDMALKVLAARLPKFVYYSTYFQVHPRIDLKSLAAREAAGDIQEGYDFGNLSLLRVVGLTAKELFELAEGRPQESQYGVNTEKYRQAMKAYQDKLDDRQNRLNAASVFLTEQIRKVWGDKQTQLRFVVDGHYLKVNVVDELGVEVELDQRSEGFRWLVSFFVVFRSQSEGDLKDAILLLDEPGMSLHALKQQQFRYTVGELAGTNQVIYTTHSPFMVGSDELNLVRIVEMSDRRAGTKVHTRISVDDPASLYPLQAALGYELAQSMFTQPRNLVCEGYTDMLYIEALNVAASDVGGGFKHPVALVPASSASKVVYYVTFLKSQEFKVAALLDSDQAGDLAAQQDELVHMLDKKQILRTKDFIKTPVKGPEIEDLLRSTLIAVAKERLGWDVSSIATSQPSRRIVDIFSKEIKGFAKYKLVQAFMLWIGEQGFKGLTLDEQSATKDLFVSVNKALP